jgi:hypothetical protein
LHDLLDNTVKSLNFANTFAFAPVLQFKTNKVFCPRCHTRLKVYRTDIRKIYMLDIGQCKAHRSFMYCSDCECVFPSEDFAKWVPPYANVGYDVMVLAGRLILCEHHTINETVLELKRRNVHISSSQVAYLSQRFIIYLSILHQQSASLLKRHIIEKGGYILHVDGTCDGASPHLVSAIDEVSNFVLANVKVPGESKEQLVPFLHQIKEQYAEPLAVSSDMGRGLLTSIAEVFPGVPHFICHFHFLRDIGKDLMEKEYALIRNKLKNHRISAKLRYRMRYEFGDNPQNIHAGEINQIAQGLEPINMHDNAAIKKLCHVLLLWVLDGKKHGNGFGFPFDRPHTEFYRRLRLLWKHLNNLQQKCITNKPIFKCITRVIGDLAPLVNDMQCMTAFQGLTKKQSVFDNLRQALSIALPGTTKGLNDTGENINMRTIEERVTQFKDNLVKSRGYHKSTAYQKLIGQIDKYWEKLFCDPIKVSTPEDDFFIQPQRTNNILEQFFRGIRRSYRRATGNNSMCKKLQSIIADTPLVKNLDNPEYMDVILDGKASLEDAFAEISQQEVMRKMQDAKKEETKIPRNVLMLIRQEETMQKLLYLIAS